ncbi:tautomerase family protein [Mycolicibacter arupensis]|jgi:phenylpyruvate tautomerase PptA (4-oxalocrotonate tautomerase family)|uniref:tautomerase family protein n=1 Tax=Mycolicibacter arupensis TaxID=342002 RepID=UPI00061B4BC1|nr:tautomerase family protein [Mycolicibacter arupensis]KAA1430441.1 tautomerase family protein [Mycolicibacter arupensis]
MPTVLIEVRRHYSQAEEVAIIDAVHGALVTAFQIPAKDKNVRLVVHEPHRFAVPAQLAQPEYRTLVSIDCFSGRSVEAKRLLYAGIVENLAELGIPRDHVMITLHESDRDNWGIRGGQAASDVDLGFTVQV